MWPLSARFSNFDRCRAFLLKSLDKYRRLMHHPPPLLFRFVRPGLLSDKPSLLLPSVCWGYYRTNPPASSSSPTCVCRCLFYNRVWLKPETRHWQNNASLFIYIFITSFICFIWTRGYYRSKKKISQTFKLGYLTKLPIIN